MQELEVSTIRRFILGDLDDATRRTIEEDVIASDDLFDRIEAIEDEIIEEYVLGELPASDRRIFDESLELIPGRRRRVELLEALSSRRAPDTDPSVVVRMKDRLRHASHARLAIAAGFAAAALTAVAFFNVRQNSVETTLPVALDANLAADSVDVSSPPRAKPETSSAVAVRRPGSPILAPATAVADVAIAGPVVTFVLSAGTTRSGGESPTLELDKAGSAVDLQVAIDDTEFSHYNAELRAPDGSSVSSHRDVPVTALGGAPVIRLSVPGDSFHSGRHELILAGVHERGTEEVAYIEFEVRRR